MAFRWVKERVISELALAGIKIGGDKPWDIKVTDSRFYSMVLLRGHDGFADAYVRGYWICKDLDKCIFRILVSGVVDRLKFRPGNVRRYLSDLFLNKQRPEKARHDVSSHYDLGDVFKAMLDEATMSYSCGYWETATTLEEAQTAKIDLICRKLGFEPGMSFCDIGCGWGGLLSHAAKKYRCDGTGITLSHNQQAHIEKLTSDTSIPIDVSLTARLADYRNFGGRFDRIASVGMFEHVGPKNYKKFMNSMNTHLKDEGLFLLHTIGVCDPSPTLKQPETPWFRKNIFPGIILPSMGQICTAADGIFKVLHAENIGKHYDPTLMAWAKNFEKGWPSIKHMYSDEFYRMWWYYLHACAAEFRSGRLEVWQIVFAKREWHDLYRVRPPVQSSPAMCK